MKPGKRSIPVICPGTWPANTHCRPPVPQPISAIKGFIGKTVYKAQCLQRPFRTARALPFHIGEKSQIKLEFEIVDSFIFVTHFLTIFCIYGKYHDTFSIICGLNLNYNNRKTLSKEVIRRVNERDNLCLEHRLFTKQIRFKCLCHTAKISNILFNQRNLRLIKIFLCTGCMLKNSTYHLASFQFLTVTASIETFFVHTFADSTINRCNRQTSPRLHGTPYNGWFPA